MRKSVVLSGKSVSKIEERGIRAAIVSGYSYQFLEIVNDFYVLSQN